MSTEAMIIAGAAALGVLLLMFFVAGLYRKVGPNQALIVYGAGGIKVVRGGGTVVWPMIQNARMLGLELMSFDVAPRKELYTSQGVAVLIDAVTQLKVRSDHESIQTSAEQFLDKSDEARDAMIKLVMEGHLRGIVGQLTVEHIVKEPEMVGEKMRKTCAEDLNKMGLEVVSFTIKEVRDSNDYIANMGRPEIERNKREANIATADAQKDTEIRVAMAQRESAVAAALADQERVIAQTASVTRQAEAQRDLEIKKAQYVETVQKQKAQADKAYEIQTAVQEQQVVAERNKALLIDREGQVKVQEAEIRRREKELQATTLKTAEIDAQRIQVLAEADKKKVELEAEGRAIASVKEGQAKIDVDVIAGEAQAKVTRINGEAEAAVTRLKGEAAAAVIKATGEAEAEAMRKKAAAYQTYNEAAVLDRIINSMPEIVRAMAGALASVDKITLVSTGGGNGSTGVDRITGDVAKVIAQVPEIIESLTGVKVGDLVKAVPRLGGGGDSPTGGGTPEIPATPRPTPAPAPRPPAAR